MSDGLRVLKVVPVGYVGGAENLFLNVAKYLPNFGVEPTLACMRPGVLVEQGNQAGVRTFGFKEHRYRNVLTVLEGRRWLADLAKQTGAHLIHATHTAHVYAQPAARKLGIPEIWHLHDYANPK